MLLLYLEKNMPLKMIVSPEKVFRLSSDVSPKPPPALLFQISNADTLSTETQMFTRLQGVTTFHPNQILLQNCWCSKPRLICKKGSLKHVSSQLINLSRRFFLSRHIFLPFFSLKIIEAEGLSTEAQPKPANSKPGRNGHSNN